MEICKAAVSDMGSALMFAKDLERGEMEEVALLSVKPAPDTVQPRPAAQSLGTWKAGEALQSLRDTAEVPKPVVQTHARALPQVTVVSVSKKCVEKDRAPL